MEETAEGLGYSIDLCAYARTNFGFLEKGGSENLNMPLPDFVCCCNNICSEVVKWYENLARELDIPLIMIDTPFNNDDEVSESRIEYFKGQFEHAIKQLEDLTGKKLDEEKLSEVMEISGKTVVCGKNPCNYPKTTIPLP